MSVRNRQEGILHNQANCIRYVVETFNMFVLITFFFLFFVTTLAMVITALARCFSL